MSVANAETFNLATGETIVGELLLNSANDAGIQVKVGDGDYRRISWSSLSQADLKKLAENEKLQQFVEPFIEVTQEERMQKTEVKIVPHTKLELPAKQSLLSAMFSSGLGLFILLVLYAANLYAAYEVSIYRTQPVGLVCGVSAVLPLIGPVIFLGMRSKTKPSKPATEDESAAADAPVTPAEGRTPAAAPAAAAAAAADTVNPMLAEGAVHPTSLHIAHEAPAAKKAPPAAVTYQRGQFTFNRRFFETKFASFFGMAHKEADKDMVLVFKTARGEFTGERITRIASSELHLLVRKGPATEEIPVPFSEIKEVQHKHKEA